MKYAHVERERRYVFSEVPEGVMSTRQVVDRYIIGTRLRLREVTEDGAITRKLSQKIRLSSGPQEVACTNFYLDEGEWDVLERLPATVLRKTRLLVDRDGIRVAVDVFKDGTIVAEIDDGENPSDLIPHWLSVLEDVSDEEQWTGARLAERLSGADPQILPCSPLLRLCPIMHIMSTWITGGTLNIAPLPLHPGQTPLVAFSK